MKDAIIHSDQGARYTSNSYKEKIQEIGLTESMSRHGKSRCALQLMIMVG